MTTDEGDKKAEAEREALQHAWNWFAMHAGQRMQVISYFLVSFALVIAGYGTSMQADNHVVAVGIAVTGAVITLSFLLLESRTRELVQAVEPALATLEERLGVRASLPDINIVKGVDKPRQRFRKYSFVIRALMWAATVLLLIAAAAAWIDASNASDQMNGPPSHHPGHSHSR
ncbi:MULTISPECIES: hypothetical protein [Nocardioides]|uniref:DUF4231 domain-containing protein n=1 Tax=Nocardioides vastitatis TaxID=2568655 RepID=A0ABW0ZLT5_9ACTN|nr:hypothetical protein [Nocardioides sp.]THI96797.1 hypothetical protein E7Z54_16195 [Nocardioides sp.]